MKKIFGLILVLVMLVSIFAILPASAEDNAKGQWNVLLNSGINLNYYEGGKFVDSVEVAAKEMGVAQTIAGNTMSVADYANGILKLDTTTERTKTLVNAMLNYGAAAQNYFNYNTDALVGTPASDTSALKAAYVPAASVKGDASVYYGVSLVLEGTLKLRFYFFGTDVEVEYDDNTQFTMPYNDNVCYFDVDIMPYAISDPVTVAVGDTVITYAPINYLYNKAINPDTPKELSDMVASIYAYGVAAKDYYVNEGCSHDVIVIDVVKPATMFNLGEQNNVCASCGKIVSTENTGKTDLSTKVITTNDGKYSYYGYHYIKNLTDEDNHFYDEGNALVIEYSLLVNETLGYTLKDANAGSLFVFGRIGDANGNVVNKIGYLHLNEKDGACPYVGGFEMSGGGTVTKFYEDNGIVVKNEAGYYVIREDVYYGWHRIGVKLYQTHEGVGDNAKYTMLAKIYIDGEEIMDITWNNKWQSANLLYTVDENGVCHDNKTDNIEVCSFVTENLMPKYTNVYIPTADGYVTCGSDFVVPVERLDTPIANAFSPEEGEVFDADAHFKPVNGVMDYPCTHLKTKITPATVATAFSDGKDAVVCAYCGELSHYITIPKTDAVSTKVITKNDDKKYSYYGYHYIKDLTDEDNHFYDEGNALVIEYSLLINETLGYTLKDATVGTWFILGRIGDVSDDNKANKIGWLHLNEKDGACPYTGGVEPGGTVTEFYEDNGIVVKNAAGYYVMKEDVYYGWHRIGVKLYQTHEGVGDNAKYTMLAKIYIDGEEIMDITYNSWMDEHLLYTVDENGVCHDNKNGQIEVCSFVTENLLPKYANVYIPTADGYVTCGSDFVVPVERLDTPIANAFSPEEGEVFDADAHFKPVNGVMNYPCTHLKTKITPATVATAFSDGKNAVVCACCGEFSHYTTIPKTGKITTKIIDNSSAKDYKYYSQYSYIKDLTDEDTHFYDEGNALIMEYSVFINESLDTATKNGKAWFTFGRIGNTNNTNLNQIGFIHIDDNDSASPYVGGFEMSGGGTVTKFYEDNGIVVKNAAGYYVMKEDVYYGWHRIGVKLYQTHEGVGSNAKYTVLAKIYIDGEEIMDITWSNNKWLTANLLYTVDENGVCHDNKTDNIEVCSLIAEKWFPRAPPRRYTFPPLMDI